jgi:hypothetical protein
MTSPNGAQRVSKTFDMPVRPPPHAVIPETITLPDSNSSPMATVPHVAPLERMGEIAARSLQAAPGHYVPGVYLG